MTAQTGAGAATFIHEPNGAPVALRTAGNSYYYLTDNQGSVVSLVDSNGTEAKHYSYDPYGNNRSTTGPSIITNPLRYTGGILDTTTGLYKLGIRYYDPALGRFTQPDPTGRNAGYTYAGNNPIHNLDPGGADFTAATLGPQDLSALSYIVGGGATIAAAATEVFSAGTLSALAFGIIVGGAIATTELGVLASYGCSVDLNVRTFYGVPTGGYAVPICP